MATVDNTLNLLVPIHLEAIVVNGNTNYWKSTSPDLSVLNTNRYVNYGALGFYMEKKIEEPGKKNDGRQDILERGVHLHWVMPDAFRKGQHKQHGELDFPAVPNRWLIVRSTAAGDVRGWVLQSDFLQPDDPQKQPSYNYIKEDITDNTIKPIKMGKLWDLAAWNEGSGSPAIDKLTIMAPGNPEFAASYIHCKNVFGFCDEMIDIKGKPLAEGTAVTYQVCGWFANKTQDPLNAVSDKASLQEKLNELSWALEGTEAMGDNVPAGTVCYAMLHSVNWANTSHTDHIPATGIDVGIGNTTSEALATLLPVALQADSSDIPKKMLAAYQYKSLSDNGLEGNGLDILKNKVHAKSFLPVDAGVIWVVQPPEREPGDNSVDISLDPFDGEVSTQLFNLNDVQGKYNRVADELASQQAELYALKFKKVFSGTRDSGQGQFVDQWAAMIAKVNSDILACVNTINDLSSQLNVLLRRPLSMYREKPDVEPQWPQDYIGSIVEQYKALLAAMEQAKMTGYEAKRTSAPQFYEPVDPAVVITGLIPSEKYLKGAAHNLLKGENEDNSKLKCRTKYVVANRLSNGRGQDVGADQLLPQSMSRIFYYIDTKNIPGGIKDLVTESLLLNPLMAKEISGASHWPVDDVIKLISTNINPANFKRKENEVVAACLPPADARTAWKQPWNPLYLEWGVNLQPLQAPTGADLLSNWKFGDKSNRIDFKYGTSLKNYQAASAPIYYGRTLLSSQFANKVTALNKTISAIFTNKKMFNDFAPMSQSLGGFSSQLIQRYNGLQLPIVNVNNGKLAVDDIYHLLGNQNSWQPKIVDSRFTPIRAGVLEIKMLRVVDSFGQVLNVYPGGLLGAKHRALKSSPGMHSILGDNRFELAPRIIQPARVRFDWMSANQPTRVTDSDPGTSPVCGWLLYNVLDKTLVVYKASGVEVGYFAKKASTNTVELLHIPDNRAAKPTGLLNPTLLQIMTFIRKNPNNFEGICQQIDSVTKKIQAKYSRQQLTMVLPTGFPIAIVNAQFLIELKGNAAKDQSWPGGLADKKFDPFKYAATIGSAATTTDGLVGYFVNQNYSRFMVSNGEKQVPLKFKSAPGEKFYTEELQKLTILMDPRTMVTLTTGLLPMGTYELPQHAIKRALKKINLRVLAAPVLTPVTSLKMPLYKGSDADWDFVSPLKAKPPLVAEEATGALTFEQVKATEGWLTLVNKSPDETI